ncbi:MAG TPA: ATP-binding protein [Pyrinomonadaceae bacterium]|nr:ATP-binding protein [Pyrinomonadaceae bacterium]
MSAEAITISRQRFTVPYMWLIIAAGAAASAYAVARLSPSTLDLRFLLLAAVTLGLGSRLSIQIPRLSSHISVSDTLIFLTMLLYGGEVAILLAAAEAFCSSLRFSKRALTITFNAAVMAASTFVTVWVLRLTFGSLTDLPHGDYSANYISALCVMALVQYISNSGLVAILAACKTDQPVWHTWTKYYLWTSVTYFAGASAAGIIAKLVATAGFYSVLAAVPIIVFVYFTYRTYLKNLEVMAAAAKAEAEAGARAEAAAAQAETAERHVAELNHYIAEQERIREQYSQIEKMSALGELASGVAHDFNNTLAGILGRAQLLLGTKDMTKIESGLKIIVKTAKDGAKTIKRIQDFARQRRDHDFQPVDTCQLLLDVSEITRPRWKDWAEAANVHISLDLQLHSKALIMGDESELREVLVNMVFNAVDAMPEGGTLTLSAQETEDKVVLSVSDTGTGMSEEVRSRIFDPFFTTKGKAGMGLGLAVGYGIIRRHDGTVEVRSEVGRGTSFRIKLPVARGVRRTAHVTNELPDLSGAAVGKPCGLRFLVVDDEEYVRALLRDILEKEGCEVVLAEGGREALALFNAETFDAIFTDVGMPEMSGWEFARAVRERDPLVPLAVVTGWGEAVGSHERKAAQVDWVVAKPFDTSQIVEIAREVSRRREVRFEVASAIVAA